MSRPLRATLLLTAVLLFLGVYASGINGEQGKDDREGAQPAPDFSKLQTGMTPEQVRQAVGTPKQIARQILYHRYREQWLYDLPIPVRLTFECPRGQKPQLLAPPRLPVGKDNAGAEKRR